MAATLRLARSGPGTPHTVRPRSQFRQLPLATWPFEPRLEPKKKAYFPHRGVRSPGQSPVGINYMQASGRQSLQLASSAHGRGLPCLPTVSCSLLTPTAPGSQLALSYPGQQAGSPGSTAGRATRSDLFRLRRATVNSVAHGRGFP